MIESKSRLGLMLLTIALALMLGITTPTLVKSYNGQTTTIQTHTIKELQSAIHEHKYVSEDGKTEKWICSEEPVLDGLNWTEEQRPLKYSVETFEKKKCGSDTVEEEHYHLWSNAYDFIDVPLAVSNLPIKCGEKTVEAFPYRTPIIVKISDVENEILRELYLMRVEDSLKLYDDIVSMGAIENGFKFLMIKVENNGSEFVISEIVTDDIEANIDEYPYADYNQGGYYEGEYTPVAEQHVLRKVK